MRARSTILLSLVAIASAAAFAWPQQAPPKFTSNTQIVLVPVLVSDGNKGSITDLKASDFEVLDDGKPQKISSFEPPQPRVQMRPAPPNATEFSNLDQPAQRRLAIIALDAQNISPGSKPFATDAITRFLSAGIASGDRIALIVLTGGGFKVLHDFTQDAASLRRAIDKVRIGTNLTPLMALGGDAIASQAGGSGDPESAAIAEAIQAMQATTQQAQTDLTENLTADSMRSVARTFGPLPGRKTFIWVTDAFPRRQDKPVLGGLRASADTGRGTNTAQFDTIFRALSDANIAIYPIDTRGLVVLIPDAANSAFAEGAHRLAEQSAENIDTMMWFAQETGGKAAYNGNDIVKALDSALSDSDSSYMLSYALPMDAKKGWHPLTVKVNRPGARVTARKGFFVGSGGVQTPEQELTAVMRSPFPYNSLPLMMRWAGTQPGSNGKKVVIFQFAVPPSGFAGYQANRFELDFGALALSPQAVVVGNVSKKFQAALNPDSAAKLAKGGFSYTGQFELPAGEYNVTFAIRDNVTGRIGSLQAPLKVQ